MAQTQRILQALKNGEMITPIGALQRFNCFRLAARINDLRNMNYKIETVQIHRKGKTFAGYFMPEYYGVIAA